MSFWPRHPATRAPAVRPIVINDLPYPSQVRLEAPAGHYTAVTLPSGRAVLEAVPRAITQANLFIEAVGHEGEGAPGYAWYGQVIDVPPDQHDWWAVPIPAANVRPLPAGWYQLPLLLVPTARFPAERGRLHADGRHLYDEQHQPWRLRGVSLFLLFHRFLHGQDITADLVWMTRRGRNVARVFGCVDWGDGLAPGYARPWERPDFDAHLRAFFALTAAKGVRVEFSVLTYAFDMNEMRAYVQRVYDIAQDFPLALIEGGNECENNGIDIVEVYRGVDRHGVLSAYGNDPERHCDAAPDADAWAACMRREVPVLDYGTSHDLRRDIHSARNPKDALEFSGLFGKPWWWDEPVGMVEPNDPLMNPPNGDGFMNHASGGGTRTINRDVIVSGQIVATFYCCGYTFHPECGAREGRAPGQGEPLQDGVAELMGQVDQFLPPDIALGQYVRPHMADFGLTWAEDDSDSLVGHAYGSLHGDAQYCVVPLPKPGLVLTAAPGWRIVAVGPVPYLVKLART
jgi:hypothetical protein